MDRLSERDDVSGRGPTDVDIGDPADRAAFGEFLRQARERRQKTLEDIASDTNISSRDLSALEEGNFQSLPRGMYRRAMLRAYAESIGLDQDAALEQFERTFEYPSPAYVVPEADLVPMSDPVPTPAPATTPRNPALLLASIVAAATVMVALTTEDRATDAASNVPPPVAVERPAPSSAVAVASQPDRTAAAVSGRPVGNESTVGAVSPRSGGTVAPPRQQEPTAGVPSASAPAVPEPARRAAAVTAAPAETVPVPASAAPPTARPAPSEEAAPTARRAALDGEIVIVSNPPGARVTVNGTGRGVTPVTVRHVPFGRLRVRVTRDGYEAEERVVSLEPARPAARLNLSLSARD